MTLLTPHASLQHAGRHVGEAAPRPAEGLSMDDLRDLMHSVTQTTQRLQQTHVALHEQVARLQRELADARAALRRSESLAALGEMAAGIAHEIRNPLASIQLYVQALAEDLHTQPAQSELCGRINRSVTTLDAIVRDVLSFARESRVDRQHTTTSALLEAGMHSCAAVLRSGDVEVSCESEPSLEVMADASRITQALSNVIRNAVEAMSEASDQSDHPRRLHLSAQSRRWRDARGQSQSGAALCVQDTGPGVPEDVRARMFNPFFTTRATGTGLGLAIVHRIVDAHGGHIEITNVSPRGARVELCLPADFESSQS